MPAKLPTSMMKVPYPTYTLETMTVGSEYDADQSSMLVDEDGSYFLNPQDKTSENGFLRVRRDESGYHVTALKPTLRWTPEKIPTKKKAKLIPVLTVTESDLCRKRNES